MKTRILVWSIIIILSVILTSCSANTNKPSVNIKQYVQQVPEPEHIDLDVCLWDLPRDTTKLVVKNITECKNISTDEELHEKCLEHPVDVNSNLMIGFDEKNYLCFVKNMGNIRNFLKYYNTLLRFNNDNIIQWNKNE